MQGERYFPRNVEDIIDVGEESFGAAHIRWAAASVRMAIGHGDRLFQLLQGNGKEQKHCFVYMLNLFLPE